jgi:hypothetical protein
VRFNGPPGSANGGIAVGALVCPALAAAAAAGEVRPSVGRVTARLRRPVVCDQALAVDVSPTEGGYAVTLRSGDDALIDGSVRLAGGASANETDAALEAALSEIAGTGADGRPPFFEETGDHPIAGCFSCGPDNRRGMHIYPRVAGDGLTCAPWHAGEEFDDGDGNISPMIVASALDCSSGICMPVQMQRELLAEDQFFLLGSLEVRYLRPAPVARDYRIVATALGRDGRKFRGRSAMFDDADVPYATADALWIVAGISRTQAFGSR